jgi:hypothetical protein
LLRVVLRIPRVPKFQETKQGFVRVRIFAESGFEDSKGSRIPRDKIGMCEGEIIRGEGFEDSKGSRIPRDKMKRTRRGEEGEDDNNNTANARESLHHYHGGVPTIER